MQKNAFKEKKKVNASNDPNSAHPFLRKHDPLLKMIFSCIITVALTSASIWISYQSYRTAEKQYEIAQKQLEIIENEKLPNFTLDINPNEKKGNLVKNSIVNIGGELSNGSLFVNARYIFYYDNTPFLYISANFYPECNDIRYSSKTHSFDFYGYPSTEQSKATNEMYDIIEESIPENYSMDKLRIQEFFKVGMKYDDYTGTTRHKVYSILRGSIYPVPDSQDAIFNEISTKNIGISLFGKDNEINKKQISDMLKKNIEKLTP